MDKQTKFLIFTDLDGTFLDHHTYSFEAAKSTLDKCLRDGHFVMPATSKTFAEVRDFQADSGLNHPFIFENGAAVAVPKHLADESMFSNECIDDFFIHAFIPKKNQWTDLIDKHKSLFSDQYQLFSAMSLEEIQQHTGLDSHKAMLSLQRWFGEPILWTGDQEQKQAFIEHFSELGANFLQGGRFLHMSGDSNKGRALGWTTDFFRSTFPLQSFSNIALGDSGNDIDMLESADFAVVIKSDSHSFPTVHKKNYLYYSESTGPEGWAEVINKLLFTPT